MLYLAYILVLHLTVSFGIRFFLLPDFGGAELETRVAVIGIIVENPESVEKINEILHIYSKYVVGRMGIPYRERNINVISIIVDAPQADISSMTGKIGRLDGVSVKAAYSTI